MPKIILVLATIVLILPNKIFAMSSYAGHNRIVNSDENTISPLDLNTYDLYNDPQSITSNFSILCQYFFQIDDKICRYTYADSDNNEYAGLAFFNCYDYHNSGKFGLITHYHDQTSSFTSGFELKEDSRDFNNIYVCANQQLYPNELFSFIDFKVASETLNQTEFENFKKCPTLYYSLEKNDDYVLASSGTIGYNVRKYSVSLAYNKNHISSSSSTRYQIKSGINNMICLSGNCSNLNIPQGFDQTTHASQNIGYEGKENDRYSDVETCTDVDVNHIKACGCIPAEVADITSKVYFILRLIGPIILLVIGGFEMAKAIAAQDESAIEKAKKKLVNKFIAAAAIFLVLTIIKLTVSLVAENTPGTFECVNILLEGYVI